MEKKKKILLFSTVSIIVILLLVGFIYQKYYNKNNDGNTGNNEIPDIKEDFKSVTFKELRVYENSYVYLDPNGKDIVRMTADEDYYIGTYGKLYTTPIAIENNSYDENEYYRCENYSVYSTNDIGTDYYIKNRVTDKTFDSHSEIIPIYFNEDRSECRYLIMKDNIDTNEDTELYIFDTTDESIHQFDSEIEYVNFDTDSSSGDMYSLTNHSNLVVETKDNKWGLADYKTNYIIDPKYQELYIYDEILLVAKLNNKFGIINTADKVMLPFEYDGIKIYDNYIVAVKNNKIGVLDRKYNVIVNYEIEYDNKAEFIYNPCCSQANTFNAREESENLIIETVSKGDLGDYREDFTLEDFNKYNYYYVIDKKGIQKELKGNDSSCNDDYVILTEMNESTITYSFYDNKYSLKARFTVKPSHSEVMFYPYVEYVNRNYYYLEAYYLNNDDLSEDIVYVDVINKEKVDKSATEYFYFDNGYSYRMEDKKLSVFKNNELLNTLEEFNYITYIGDYMFLIGYENRTDRIVKVIFNKES